jgi:hypothetical protein
MKAELYYENIHGLVEDPQSGRRHMSNAPYNIALYGMSARRFLHPLSNDLPQL